MITDFSATDFRGFRSISVGDFRAVNVIVGPSASGKTAFLEAIRLGVGGTPNVAWQLNAIRSLPAFVLQNPTKEQFEAIWSPLFYDFDVSRRINITVGQGEVGKASVEIFFDADKQSAPLPSIQNGQVGFPITPLGFRRFDYAGVESIIYANLNSQGTLNLDAAPELGPRTELFTAAWQTNVQQVAGWFSALSIANREGDIVSIVRDQFPRILDLTVQTPNLFPSLYATLDHLSHKLPVSLVSSGINKFISILIGIATTDGGVLLIDEIENGIYYRLFDSLWKSLHSLAKSNNTQLFLTTHSLECLRALAPLIELFPDDFALIQLTTHAEENFAFVVKGENAAAAIEGGVEVRG